MADTTLHGLTSTTTPASTDELYLARSPFGTGDDRRITFANLEAGLTLANQTGYSLLGLKAGNLSQFAATTSAQLASIISDETGTGGLVFANTPTLVTPILGVATATSMNKVAITAPATGSTLTIADGATLTAPSNATVSGTNTGDQTISLTGDVTGSGTGSFAATIANGAVQLNKMANMTTAAFIGRQTSGSGAPEILLASDATALLTPMVGDSGAGGTKGLVPAPATGDATKFLRGDATWVTVSGGGTPGGSDTQIQYNNAGAFGGVAPLTYNGSTLSSSGLTMTGDLTIGTAGAIDDNAGTLSIIGATSAPLLLDTDGGAVTIGGDAVSLTLLPAFTAIGGGASASELRFLEPSGGGTAYTGFKSPALAGNVMYTLPTADGTTGQVLSTNGSGAMSWITAGGGLSWGATANGTSGTGVGLTVSNSSAASTIGQSITAGDTQSNSVALTAGYSGTSAKVIGALYKGTFGTTNGDIGTGNYGVGVWDNRAAAATRSFVAANGTSMTANWYVQSDGRMVQPTVNTGNGIDVTVSSGGAAAANTVGLNITIPNGIQTNTGLKGLLIRTETGRANVLPLLIDGGRASGWGATAGNNWTDNGPAFGMVSSNGSGVFFMGYTGTQGSYTSITHTVGFKNNGHAFLINSGDDTGTPILAIGGAQNAGDHLMFGQGYNNASLFTGKIIGTSNANPSMTAYASNGRTDSLAWELDVTNSTVYTTARTADYFKLKHGRTHGNDSVTDNFVNSYILRDTRKNGTGTTLAQGSAQTVENANTITSGGLTDTVVVQKLIQASNSTGDILQGIFGSTTMFSVGTSGKISLDATNTAGGTTGNVTISKPTGSANLAAAASSLVVTNTLVTTSSKIFLNVSTNDTTMKGAYAVPASGSFTIYADVAPTAETRIDFVVIN